MHVALYSRGGCTRLQQTSPAAASIAVHPNKILCNQEIQLLSTTSVNFIAWSTDFSASRTFFSKELVYFSDSFYHYLPSDPVKS